MTTCPAVRPVDAIRWELIEPWQADTPAGTVHIPVGYVTDFASVPRVTAWLIPRTGDYSPAAIVHDYLITDILPAGHITSAEVDRVFREVMRELGVPGPRRWLMWAGVRWGAAFNRKRWGGWWRTAPGVLGVSLLALPVILPGAVGVLASTTLLWILSLLVPRRSRPNSWST